MVGNDTLLYDRVYPAHQEAAVVGDGREYPIAFFEKLDLAFHSTQEAYAKLMNVEYVPEINLTCFHCTLSRPKSLLK